MSSINFFPTFEYSQPEEYRFSHDSVFFARWLFERMRSEQIQQTRAVDLGAGCGIIGLDLLYHFHKEAPEICPAEMSFLEVQSSIYETHFKKNILTFEESSPLRAKIHWLSSNYKDYVAEKKLDLIFSNPPYFFPEEGLLSPNDFKNRCRFFLDASFEDFVNCLDRNLSSSGSAYFLFRDRTNTKGESLDQLLKRKHLSHLNIKCCGEIRSTLILQFNKS